MKTLIKVLVSLLFSIQFANAQTTKTIGSGGDYLTVKSAFDAINSGTLSGALTFQVISNISDNNSAILNASGTGSANYTSVNIYPTNSGYTLSGNIAGPLISFNGADNVTIDGRVNSNGSTKSLVITNTNTGTGSSTIRFTNSAENNTVKYCIVKGSETNTISGIFLFSTSTNGNGNDNNLIDNNDITSDAAGRPNNAISSSGTTGRENSGNIISNNNFYDFLRSASYSNGIYIQSNSNDFVISGNNFFETTTLSPTGTNAFYIINISTSVSHEISGNYIGGSAPQCGGGAWVVNSSFSHFMYAIYISGGISNPVIVENNTIQNINYTSTNRNPWDGIYLASGNITVTGNTIGAGTGNGSIVVNTPNASATATLSAGTISAINIIGGGSGYTTAPTISFSQSGSTTSAVATAIISGGVVTGYTITNPGVGYTSIPTISFNGADYSTTHGIRHVSLGAVTISNNTIGSITATGSATYSHCLEAIVISGSTSAVTISNNNIGSPSTTNSLQTNTTGVSSNTKQDLRGIYINSAVTQSTVIGNTIANMSNAYTGSSSSKTDGICTSGGSNTIQNNSIYNISAASSAVLVKGIQQSVTTTGTNQIVTGNTIYNLSNTSSTTTVITGIQYSGPITTSNTVSGNFIHSLSLSSTSISSEMDGIVLGGGVVTCANNIINIGSGASVGYKVYGIYDNSSGIVTNTSNIYFNSIFIGGTVTVGSTSSTAALWNSNNTCIRNYKNNILINQRTGGTTGKHYSIRASGTSGLTIDYNDYYVSASGVLGYISSADKTTLVMWKAATSQDGSSLNSDPLFTSAGGISPNDYIIAATLPAVTGTGILLDYQGITRTITPIMGALEANNFVWQGTLSNDFGTAANWAGGTVPPNGADISFAVSPTNHCVLDQDRTLVNITNAQSVYNLVINGKKLTINGVLTFSNNAKINATSSSSTIIFSGLTSQSIPANTFVSNTIASIIINNPSGLSTNNDFIFQEAVTLTNGALNIGGNTITINGSISATNGSLNGGNTSNIIFGGSITTSLPSVTLKNLTINRSGGITLGGDVVVNETLTLTDGTVTIGAHSLTIAGNSPIRSNGNIDASNNSATLIFANATAIILPASLFTGSINNLTINGIGGVTAGSDLTIDGVLNLNEANPSTTKGLLEMAINYSNYPGTTNNDYLNSHILNMGATATTIGIGDVTGTIRRGTIIENTPYTFGHRFTTISLTTGTMPDAIAVTVTIGTTPAGNIDAVKRTYEIVPTVAGGYTSTSHVTANFHYLDGELTSSIGTNHVNTESKVVTMDYDIGGGFGTPDEHGRSAYDFTNNYIGFSNIPISYFIKVAGHNWRTIFHLSDFVTGYYTWDGSTSSDWGVSSNWTPTGMPSDVSHVIIPNAATTPNDPILPPGVTINTLTIQNGGILIMGSETLTIKNSLSGGWEDQNIIGNDPATSKVIFSMPGTTISGNASFYDVEIADGADITNQTGSSMKIAHSITRTGTGKWFSDVFGGTIEYSGNNQTVLASDASPYYHNLILSGNGIKTLPASPMLLHGNLILRGSASINANAPITISGSLIIENGASFTTGNYDHTIKGNLDNSGTLITSPGYSILMDGTSVQSILGTSTNTFENLTINNIGGVGIFSNSTINNILTLTNGNLSIGNTTLTINGAINRTSGLLDVSSVSTLSFGGNAAITLSPTLFSNSPSVYNLNINNTGGVIMNTNFTVTNSLSINSGKLEIQPGNTITSLVDFSNSGTGVLVNNGNLIINGNFANDQALMASGTGTLTLSGSSIQTLSGSQTFFTNNLNTNNSEGIILNNNLSVSGVHTFTVGVITTSPTPNFLIYEPGASHIGASDGNHVNGWIKKTGSTDFDFPVGNSIYVRPIKLSSISSSSTFNVKYNLPSTPNNTQLSDPLVYVNASEYWTINKISGGDAAVTLNWDNSKVAFPNVILSDIRAAQFDGSTWINIGGSATGDVSTTGTVTSNSINSFNNNFTIGSISYILPLKLVSFTARKLNNYVAIAWKISDEQAVAKYELERSDDGFTFYSISIQASGNKSGIASYSYFDLKTINGTVYYRLRLIKNSGLTTYSTVIIVSAINTNKEFYVISNPVATCVDLYAGATVLGNYTYSISSTAGQVIQKGNMEILYPGIHSILLSAKVPSGAYILVVGNEKNKITKVLIKK